MTDLPEPTECWKASPEKPAGDDDPASIYLAVGAALSHWESVENSFAMLFAALVESSSPAASRTFGAIVGNPSRRDVLNRSAQIFLKRHPVTLDDQEEFETLMEHYRLASGRSSEIAHGVVSRLNLADEDCGSFLVPPEYRSKLTGASTADGQDPRKYSVASGNYRYTSHDIAEFASKFHNFQLAIVRFLEEIAQRYGS